ncbi:hypothetical protein CEXT_134221 [Caerostris extrusa]|uniref:Uncharacterized protein n=1 Tax=Caerostris extrusa TaxID=172846 RepID=A0AAV4RYL4_CAEEX|nr:hypothetical protein CEXT_134221 [Caerostris extrusa]
MRKVAFPQLFKTKNSPGSLTEAWAGKFNESMIRIFKDGWRMDIINPPFGMTSGVIPCFKIHAMRNCPIKAITEGKQLEKIKSNRDKNTHNN